MSKDTTALAYFEMDDWFWLKDQYGTETRDTVVLAVNNSLDVICHQFDGSWTDSGNVYQILEFPDVEVMLRAKNMLDEVLINILIEMSYPDNRVIYYNPKVVAGFALRKEWQLSASSHLKNEKAWRKELKLRDSGPETIKDRTKLVQEGVLPFNPDRCNQIAEKMVEDLIMHGFDPVTGIAPFVAAGSDLMILRKALWTKYGNPSIPVQYPVIEISPDLL